MMDGVLRFWTVPGSSTVNSYSCEDNFSQLNPKVLRGFSEIFGPKPQSRAQRMKQAPGSSTVNSYSCEDNFSQLNQKVLRGFSRN